MRIVITADPFIAVPPLNYGGIERIIHFLVEGLAAKGHEVFLVANKDSKVSVPLIAYPPLQNGIVGHIKNMMTINQSKKFKPDIIHSFSRLAYLLPYLQTAVPKLMSYQREPTINQIVKIKKLSKKDTLSFTGCSDYISKQILPFAPSYTIYNGVPLKTYDFISHVTADAPLVFLGRIEFIKGTHLAIEAALKTNNKLVIAGNVPTDTTSQQYFKDKVEPYIDNNQIQYIGPVNDAQKNILLGSAKAFLMPLEWNEPFGIVMPEAMACGTPVIGFPKGAVAEVVKHGVNGFIAKDLEELCLMIDKVDTIDRKKVRQSVEESFSSNVIVEQYENLYKKLISFH